MLITIKNYWIFNNYKKITGKVWFCTKSSLSLFFKLSSQWLILYYIIIVIEEEVENLF